MDIDQLLRGYTAEQYCCSIIITLINFLAEKKIIDKNECLKYINDNVNEILNKVLEEDKKEINRRYEQSQKEWDEYKKA